MYIIRLDDASEHMDVVKWNKIEKMLDNYGIVPIIGVIPNNDDKSLIDKYEYDNKFWEKAKKWQSKNWIIAMHGYSHNYLTKNGGVNPVQNRSEFAGVSLEKQSEKIRKGNDILEKHGIVARVFFAPSHTFDENTLLALKKETSIRIISDTIARNIYFYKDFFFIPLQSGVVRNLPFQVVTFCYHPNEMEDKDFEKLEKFIISNKEKFKVIDLKKMKKRKKDALDRLLSYLYFLRRK